MKKTGQQLKAEREKQGISLNEISMSTKISVRMLTALEEGNLDDLPAKTFLRGFVQSYASQLKMDTDAVLETFHDEMGSTLVKPTPPASEQVEVSEPLPIEPENPRPAASKEMAPSTNTEPTSDVKPVIDDLIEKAKKFGLLSKLMYVGVSLALVFMIIGVRNIVIKYEKEGTVEDVPQDIKSLEAAETNDSSAPAESTIESTSDQKQPDSSALTKQTAKETEPKPNKKKVEKADAKIEAPPKPPQTAGAPEMKEKPEVSQQADTNAEKPEAKPEPAALAQKKPSPEPKQTDDKPKAEPSRAAPAVGQNEIIIEALDSVDIEFRIGSGDLQRMTLNPDQVHTIKANAQVRIDISDGGAVNITHNGRDRGVPGDLGKPKKVILP